MNRRQKRQQTKVVEVPVSQLDTNFPSWPQAVQHWAVLYRIKKNLAETGHPWHHKTADGTIVDLDVTLEHWISQLKALPSVPVNRTHYGFNLYADKGGN